MPQLQRARPKTPIKSGPLPDWSTAIRKGNEQLYGGPPPEELTWTQKLRNVGQDLKRELAPSKLLTQVIVALVVALLLMLVFNRTLSRVGV